MEWDASRVFLGEFSRVYCCFNLTYDVLTISVYSAANWFKCGLETLLLGGACATVAYTIGQFVDKHVVA